MPFLDFNFQKKSGHAMHFSSMPIYDVLVGIFLSFKFLASRALWLVHEGLMESRISFFSNCPF
jgi:hypothetical protein